MADERLRKVLDTTIEELCDTPLPDLSRARNSVPELIICQPSGSAVKKVKYRVNCDVP